MPVKQNIKRLTLPHRPTGDQLNYYNLATRFTIGCIGRQYGKSTMATLRSVRRQFERKGNYWFVSPIVSQAKVQFKRAI